jgi:ADP-ribose pyrophosphatase
MSDGVDPMQTRRLLSYDRVTQLTWLNLYNVFYKDKNGRRRNWEIASRLSPPKCFSGRFATPDAVVIAAFHVGLEQMVMTREFRVPLADYEYGFPAGLVDEGESTEDAAKRELAEETGFEVRRILRTGPPVYSSAGLTDESVSMVYVECDGRASNRGNAGSEEIEVILVSPRQARRLCADATLKFDAKAWLVLSAYGRTGTLAY